VAVSRRPGAVGPVVDPGSGTGVHGRRAM